MFNGLSLLLMTAAYFYLIYAYTKKPGATNTGSEINNLEGHNV